MLSATWAAQETTLNMRHPHLGFGMHVAKEQSSDSSTTAQENAIEYSAEDMPAGF